MGNNLENLKKELQAKIEELKNQLPKNLIEELFVDFDEDTIENANLVTGKGSVFYIESANHSSYYTIVFDYNKEIIIDYIEYNQLNTDEEKKIKIDKRTRYLQKKDDIYILAKEYPERMINEKDFISKEMYIKEISEYDEFGNMINPENRKFYVGGIIYKSDLSVKDAIKRKFENEQELKEIQVNVALINKKATRTM